MLYSKDWLLANFDLVMFILASIATVVHSLVDTRQSPYEILYRWFILLPVGITAIYVFLMHIFFPQHVSSIYGWQMSPYQIQMAMANLGYGITAILSFKASYHFRLATVVGVTFWLWGNAVGHVYQIQVLHTLSPDKAGSWIFTDMFVPIILIISMLKLKRYSHVRS